MIRKKIWIPEVEQHNSCQTIELPPVGVEGYYYIDLIDKNTGNTKQHWEFKNTITDFGINMMFICGTTIDAGVFSWCAVGDGTGSTNFNDTTLQNQIGSRVNTGGSLTSGSNSIPEYHWIRINRIFNESQANGTLREVGFFTGSADNSMTCRSLFYDSLGNTTTINKTSQDILNITYEFRIYSSQSDVIGSFQIAPSITSNYIIRPQGMLQSNGWERLVRRFSFWQPQALVSSTAFLNTRTGFNNPVGDQPSTVTSFPYVNNTFYRDVQYTWLDILANFNTSTLVWRYHSIGAGDAQWYWQMSLNPAVPKNSDQRLDLILRQSISRI